MRNDKRVGTKSRKEYLVEIVREMIAREAKDVDDAKDLAQYVGVPTFFPVKIPSKQKKK